MGMDTGGSIPGRTGIRQRTHPRRRFSRTYPLPHGSVSSLTGTTSVVHASPGGAYDVVVVGGGPAGASAALCLARAGVKVAVLEQHALPRYKTCGGGVVGRAVRLLPLSIRGAVERECFTAEVNLLDSGLHFKTTRQAPIISMTMRDAFDDLLLSAAEGAGAHIRPRCRVAEVYSRDGGLELLTSTGSVSAGFVVAADGARSTVARTRRWPDDRRLIPALECEVFVDEGLLAQFAGSARFDFGLVPHGYGWVFPKETHLSIGVLTMRCGSVNLNEHLRAYLRLLNVAPALRMERHGSLIPVTTRRAPFASDRVLLVGDAAGFVDPLTGEGITFAIRSGQIAAAALLKGNLHPETVARTYDADVAIQVLSELRVARVLATPLYDCPALRSTLFRLFGQRFSEAVTDVLTGDRTYRELVTTPVNYLTLLKAWGRST